MYTPALSSGCSEVWVIAAATEHPHEHIHYIRTQNTLLMHQVGINCLQIPTFQLARRQHSACTGIIVSVRVHKL